MTQEEFENLKQWAEAGHAKAMFDLAVCYGTGRGVRKNHAQAIHWYQKAADSDNAKTTDLVRAQAMFNLAVYYETDLSEHAQAFHWYQKAADLGVVQAMFNLAAYYAKGQYVAQDYTQAVYWSQKVIDSENNKDTDLLKAEAMFNLGICYNYGTGVIKDHARAHSWYQKAADLDNINAMFNLAIDYVKGQGVVQDHSQAFYWYQKIADSGNTETTGLRKAQAMFNLGLFYDRGLGVVQNNVQAVYWYQKAADLGITESMLNLGVCYAKGQGVQNNAQAIYWYKKAADLGNRDAMFNLAAHFYLGLGAKKNTKQAIFWFKKAATDGKHQKALLFLMDEKNGLGNTVVNWAKNLLLERYFPVFAHFKTLTIDLDAKTTTSCCTRFEKLMHSIVKIENDHLFKNINNGLSHYTKQNVLDALLGGRAAHTGKQAVTTLRQYMTAYLNDPTEGLYVFDEACFEGIPELETFDVELIHNRFRDFRADGDDAEHIPAQMFSLSLSKNKDSLDLWRAYTVTDGRANGVAVHIPAQTLASFTADFSQGLTSVSLTRSNGKNDQALDEDASQVNFLLYEVRYGEKPVQDLWRQLKKPLNDALQAIKRVEDKATQRRLYDCIVLALMRLTYLYKHDAYTSEQEVRAIHIAEINEASVKTDERAPARLYINSPALLFQDIGGEITLGPQMSPDEQAVLLWETRKRLIDLRLDKKVKVKTSKIPFR
ncbi:Secretory immunoglobulin A-binding protein EsiB [Ephemeroptericola cinctiostellae]|uniref:Secretory immunoglobulin A-binding protein EsiB n=1 Tax=Ephemeroptericola cinctiostellae TaxID=2268024 RepID=A0A345DAU4_9BURK|nr:tetratricopeptide repeat protein [Ephemeroptericola cinctiostellae]AXF85482.1 Secretory immunoglobulin A-binding protein EsiB [Ephemeroptericola cinctiostellae]